MAPPAQGVNALEVEQATVVDRLIDVTVRLPRGQLVGLIGPNGSGKSTLLQIAGGLLPASGRVLWGGRSLASLPILERGRLATWVPQEARFEFGFSVRDVVAQGRYAHGDDEFGVAEVLERFNLTGLSLRPVNQLSGGERHRVLLARAVATDAPLQLWDEPLAQLDPRHALEVLMLARQLTQSGKTIFFSLHDLRVAHCLDQIVVLHQGRLRAAGRPDQVLSPELLLDVFGVRARNLNGLSLELP